MTMDAYPNVYVSTNRISYKFVNFDTLNTANDTTQRIDINLVSSSSTTKPYSFESSQGLVNIFDAALPNIVTDIPGYTRYMVPNIYNGIDLHYYSNGNGLKLYYVIKPFSEADPNDIKWAINGANSTSIISNKLEIVGFNTKVTFDTPYVYQVGPSSNIIRRILLDFYWFKHICNINTCI